VVAGAAVAGLGTAVGFVHTLRMGGDMSGDMSAAGGGPGTARHLLHGMPLASMPEMFIAAAGLLLVLAASVRAGTQRPTARPLTGAARAAAAAAVTAALTIDISKTSTLGFVIPGMRAEYGLAPRTASLLAVCGLSGTAAGALLFGLLADRLGRRRTYLLTTLGFTVTAMCGAMPTFTGNLLMCATMGLAVGGLAPLLITLLGDILGQGVRGPLTAALSVLAAAIGYLVAASTALWLEPALGWRILWLIGVPTGLLLVLLLPLVPELRASHVLGSGPGAEAAGARSARARRVLSPPVQYGYASLVGIVTFGLLTWLPTLARAGGVAPGTANTLLTVAALAMVPCAGLLALGYLRFGSVALSAGLALSTAVPLFALTASGTTARVGWLCAGALVAALFALNTMAAVFLPIAADLADPARRGSTTGRVSFFNRLGGLTGPVLLASLISSQARVFATVAALATACGLYSIFIMHRYRATFG
jgi:putative MFS transporter